MGVRAIVPHGRIARDGWLARVAGTSRALDESVGPITQQAVATIDAPAHRDRGAFDDEGIPLRVSQFFGSPHQYRAVRIHAYPDLAGIPHRHPIADVDDVAIGEVLDPDGRRWTHA